MIGIFKLIKNLSKIIINEIIHNMLIEYHVNKSFLHINSEDFTKENSETHRVQIGSESLFKHFL